MSAKNRDPNYKPSKNEYYRTPDWCIKAIMDIYNPFNLSVFEPGCADAPFLERARELKAKRTVGYELRDVEVFDHVDKFIYGDFTDSMSVLNNLNGEKFDLVFMNPPFSLTEEFVNTSLKLIDKEYGKVVCLQRLNFLAGKKRYSRFNSKGNLCAVHVLVNRPKFIEGTSGDACEYGFLVFDNNYNKFAKLNWIERK